MLFHKIPGSPQLRFYLSRCVYCGKLYIKTENRTTYCSHDCRHKSIQDSKARYQRKRRKLIKDGELISNENNFIGTTFLSKHPQKDFKKEHENILKEARRLGVRKHEFR